MSVLCLSSDLGLGFILVLLNCCSLLGTKGVVQLALLEEQIRVQVSQFAVALLNPCRQELVAGPLCNAVALWYWDQGLDSQTSWQQLVSVTSLAESNLSRK